MLEASEYLLSVVAHYRGAIEDGNLDDVLEDVDLGLWRLDPSVGDLEAEVLELTGEMFRQVHGRVLAGAYAQALEHLDGLQSYLERLHAEAKRETGSRSP